MELLDHFYESHWRKLYASFGSGVVLIMICGHLLLWQQKEKEPKKLRQSLEKHKQEAKSHELQAGASKHVEITFYHIYSSTGAEALLLLFKWRRQ